MLKEVEQDELEHTNMKRYKGWQTGSGDGSNLTVLQNSQSGFRIQASLTPWKTVFLDDDGKRQDSQLRQA